MKSALKLDVVVETFNNLTHEAGFLSTASCDKANNTARAGYNSNNNNGKTKEQIANKYSQPKVSNERYRASYDFNDGGCSWWLNNKNNKCLLGSISSKH
uniref:Uncharacterized protein n=1 Tax=Glossina palpalis gambiensis TaxID=67801 RepID=A0A1B0B4U4_9MUSC